MRAVLTLTGMGVLFVLGLLVAACGSGATARPTETTHKAGTPYGSSVGIPPSQTVQHSEPLDRRTVAETTRTTVTTVGYLDSNGNEGTATLTYTTTTWRRTATFTDTVEP